MSLRNARVRKVVAAAGARLGGDASSWARQPSIDFGSGALVTDWTGANITLTGNAAVVTPPLPILGAKALQLTANASAAQGDITLATPINEADFTALSFVAHNPGTEPQAIRVFVSSTSNFSPNTSYAQQEMVLWPGTWTYAINRESFKRGDGNSVRFWGSGASIVVIRIKEVDNASQAYYAPTTTSSSLIGPIRMTAAGSQAVMLLQTDDGRAVNWQAPAVTNGRSFYDMFNARGWRGTAYIVPSLVGSAGYMTWRQVLDLEDAGWTIAPHSDLHPVGDATRVDWGLRMYRWYNAANGTFDSANTELDAATTIALIRADLESCRDKLYAAGVRSGLDHLALPQGGYDERVEEAIRQAGFKTVRGVLSGSNRFVVNLPISGAAQNRMACMGGVMNTIVPHSPTVNLPSSKSFEAFTWGDNAQTDCKLYIDEVVRLGGVGSSYMHQTLDASMQANYDQAFDYIKGLEQQGKLKVMPLHDWWGGR
ncbi:MAG: polysaccharide deacetylase family protein [Pseudomonadota bacterium]